MVEKFEVLRIFFILKNSIREKGFFGQILKDFFYP